MQNYLNNLIEKGKKLNTLSLHMTNWAISSNAFEAVKEIFNIVLPSDFIEISSFIRYEGFNMVQFFDFEEDPESWNCIIKNNIELRKEFLNFSNGKADMSDILALSYDDGGSVFMVIQDSPEKSTPVMWCNYGDLYNYVTTGKFNDDHDEWPSFATFFEYLVEREEKKLQEEGILSKIS